MLFSTVLMRNDVHLMISNMRLWVPFTVNDYHQNANSKCDTSAAPCIRFSVISGLFELINTLRETSCSSCWIVATTITWLTPILGGNQSCHAHSRDCFLIWLFSHYSTKKKKKKQIEILKALKTWEILQRMCILLRLINVVRFELLNSECKNSCLKKFIEHML